MAKDRADGVDERDIAEEAEFAAEINGQQPSPDHPEIVFGPKDGVNPDRDDLQETLDEMGIDSDGR